MVSQPSLVVPVPSSTSTRFADTPMEVGAVPNVAGAVRYTPATPAGAVTSSTRSASSREGAALATLLPVHTRWGPFTAEAARSAFDMVLQSLPVCVSRRKVEKMSI